MSKTVLLCVLSVVSLAQLTLADDNGVNTVAYNADTFNEKVPNTNHFVMFYAPWCGHCKRLHPAWEELATKYNKQDDPEVTVANVDCTVETALCSEHDVTGYPTLKFFKEGEKSSNAEKYRGQRDVDSLVKFINKKLGNEVEEDEQEAVVEPEIATADKGLYVLNQKSFANHVKTGNHFIKFYAPWCGHCQKLAPTWDDLAKDLESDDSIKIAKLDCTTSQNICQENEVRGYPTLAYFRNGKKIETYRGARSLGELKEFVKSMKEEAVKDTEDKKAEQPEKRNVVMLNEKSFSDGIKSGVTFVKFFAPWCGHCKRLAPTWEELADKYADQDAVTIAKVDCTSDEHNNKDLCNQQGVNGFPTLNIYKDGEKVEEFNGKRDVDSLAAFVDKHVKAKDEL